MKITIQSSIRKILDYTLQPFNIKFRKEGILIHVSHGIGYTNFSLASEKWFEDLLLRLNRIEDFKKGLFIDVGTNIGQTLIKLKRINKNMRYIGFEPNPHCFYYTTCLIEDNQWDDCAVYPFGLSDKIGNVTLWLGNKIDAEGSIIAGLRPNKNKNQKRIINTQVFDDLFPQSDIKDAKIIKVDVEGAELHVLTGMQRTLQTYRPLLICEVLHANSEKEREACRIRNQNLIDLFRDQSYNVYRIRKANHKVAALEKISMFEDRIFSSDSPQLCDFLIIPMEKQSILKVFQNQ